MKTIEQAQDEHSLYKDGDNFSFRAGAEFAQRWIPVKEELPEVKKSDYQVLAKSIYGYEILDIDTDTDVEGTISLNDITHWRPIEIK